METKTSDIYQKLDKLIWAKEPMTLLQLIESLEVPQIAKIASSNINDIQENEYLLLHSVYDRYVLLGVPTLSKKHSNNSYLIPDWYRAHCHVVSTNPKIQKQYWNFQGASEINRFNLPRDINFLVETPIYRFTQKLNNKNEWKRVVLKRNARLTVTKMISYSVNSKTMGNCFILSDKKGAKYLLPVEYNIKFSVEISPDEYNSSYFDHKSIFSLPEIVTRYELPIEVEFKQHPEHESVSGNKVPNSPFKLISLAIVKSIIGVVFNTNTKQHRFIELSPAAQIKLSIPQCLQHGLLNPDIQLSQEEEKEYSLYNKIREVTLNNCHKQCELYKFDMRLATNDERDSMIRIYESGIKYKQEEESKMYDKYLLDMKSPEALNPDAKIPFISLKNLFLRPNIDSGDPYDDVNHDHSEEDPRFSASHDLSAFSTMNEKLITDSMSSHRQ